MKQVPSELQVKHVISQSEGEALRLGREGAWQAESRGGSAPWSAPSVFQGALLLHSLQPNFPVLIGHFKTCIALLSKPEVSFSSAYIYLFFSPNQEQGVIIFTAQLHSPPRFSAYVNPRCTCGHSPKGGGIVSFFFFRRRIFPVFCASLLLPLVENV